MLAADWLPDGRFTQPEIPGYGWRPGREPLDNVPRQVRLIWVPRCNAGMIDNSSIAIHVFGQRVFCGRPEGHGGRHAMYVLDLARSVTHYVIRAVWP